SDAWKLVKKHIEKVLKFATVVSMTEAPVGTINEKVRSAVWHDCDCAVAILSADDLLADGTLNAPPNVLFEIGYLAGFFDLRYWDDPRLDAVILLKDRRTQVPSDLLGVEYLPYDGASGSDVSATFPKLDVALEALYRKINDYFTE